MSLTSTEENYLKALFKISVSNGTGKSGINELAESLSLKPASVNEMLKRLKEKKLVDYEKYGKVELTKTGKSSAVDLIRKHRLWETFLYEKLSFSWEEVHEVAEELEHIKSKKLIDQLDDFLGNPKFDPHGDPIPDKNGVFIQQSKKTLNDIEIGARCRMVAVKDNSRTFLQYVVSLGLAINNEIKIISREAFDGQLTIEINGNEKSVSQKFAENIFVIGTYN